MGLALEELKDLSKDKILTHAGNRAYSVPSFWTTKDYYGQDEQRQIDLGVHKHDIETMSFILTNLGKYYYIINLSIENFVHHECLVSYFIDGSPFPADWVGNETVQLAIKRFGSQYGEAFFLALITQLLERNYLKEYLNGEYLNLEEMTTAIFRPHRKLGAMLEPAKALLRDEANMHLLPEFIEDYMK